MKARDYCCCAIPIVNAGIYATLIEQTILGILVGTLSIATPSIVGAATPAIAPVILAILAYVAVVVQILGFIGVARETPITFRRYLTLHIFISLAAFSVAAVWIAISASRHSVAKSKCESDFFPSSSTDTETTEEGQTMCNIFPWVDVGVMAGLWVVLALAQTYFWTVLSSYSHGQQHDHASYDTVFGSANVLTANDIPMTNQKESWNSRPSAEALTGRAGPGYRHIRQDSQTSASDVMGGEFQQPKDTMDPGYGRYGQTAYPPQPRDVSYPGQAYTQEPVPTPQYNDQFYSSGVVDMDRPVHPAEGFFHRKTPRLTQANAPNFNGSFVGR
jgi:hypothetical protein